MDEKMKESVTVSLADSVRNPTTETATSVCVVVALAFAFFRVPVILMGCCLFYEGFFMRINVFFYELPI